MRRLWVGLLGLFVCLGCAIAAADGFSVIPAGPISGYGENYLMIQTPGAGTLEVTIGDSYAVYRHLTGTVEAGEGQWIWDGLADDGQRIGQYTGTYQLTAEWIGADGASATDSRSVQMEASRQVLLFAIPSSPVLYLENDEVWFVELQLSRSAENGRIRMQVCAAEDPSQVVFTRDIHPKGTDVFQYHWNGRNAAVTPGHYTVSMWLMGASDRTHMFPLEVRAGKPPVQEVQPTGEILPRNGMSDEEIWAVMQKPSVVVDIRPVAHQKVYQEPSLKSNVLGTLHGQTQALEVLEVSGKWVRINAWRHEDGEFISGYVPLKQLKVVQPDARYGLLIDKEAQTLTLFEEGRSVTTLPISSGLPAKDRLIRETAAGCFLTGDRLADFTSEGYHYRWCIRYDGGNLIHSVGTKLVNRHSDSTWQNTQLGQKASHGCVRVPRLPMDESGIDAWWLYTHLPYRTRVIILDDPLTRRAQAAAAQTDMDPAIATAYPEEKQHDAAIPAFGEDVREIVMTFGGDTVIGTREIWWKQEDAFPAYLERYGMDYPFQALRELFAADDLTMVNLECTLKANRDYEDKSKRYRFRGMPSWTQVLTGSSVELVNIANNHYIDYGPNGKKTTRDALTQGGLPFSGYGHTYIAEIKGVKIGFAGIRETMYLKDKPKLAAEIQGLRAAGCDLVIYTCHWGVEYSPQHNSLQLGMAQVAVAAGADLVIGGHPHVVQGISVLREVPVVWSLGNLMFGGTIELSTFDGLLVRARFKFRDDTYLGCLLELLPVRTSGRAAEGINDYRPVPAEGEDAQRILQLIQADSLFPIAQTLWFPRTP